MRDGDGARSRRDWASARLSYSKAVATDETLWPIWIQLGHASKENGDYAAAELAYRKALLLNPAVADSHLQFAHLMKITKRYPAALASYAYALVLQPNLIDARREIEGLWRRGDIPERRQNPKLSETDMQVFRQQGNPITGPDFLCIGMGKAGTGWLFDQLKNHPDFWMPPVKEFAYLRRSSHSLRDHAVKQLASLRRGNRLDWANRGPNDDRDLVFLKEATRVVGNARDLASYAALFRYKHGKLTGDITPGYGRLAGEAIAEIGAALPKTKLVLLVRDPVQRAWSHISMLARNKLFDITLLDDPTRLAHFLTTDERFSPMFFATALIRNWRVHAPELDLRVFLFDDVVENPAKTLKDILVFLGAQPALVPTKSHGSDAKRSKSKLELTQITESVLVQHFREELLECASVLGGAAAGWPARYRVA